MSTETIWISWHHSRRSQTLARHLEIPLVAVQYEGGPFKRHVKSAAWSLVKLIRFRPETIFLQYSFLLLVILALYKALAPFSVIIVCDCHTKALRRRLRGKGRHLFSRLKKWSFSSADMLILANYGQVEDAEKVSEKYVIVPDLIPEFRIDHHNNIQYPYCVISMSFDKDEPLDEIADAAELIAEYQKIFITGSAPAWFEKRFSDHRNVHLTGFISDKSYLSLMKSASCIVSLTDEEGCLQCSGYEALALEVPFVTSSTRALREYFDDAAVFVEHSPASIAEGVKHALVRSAQFRISMAQLKQKKIALQASNIELLRYISAPDSTVDGELLIDDESEMLSE